MNSMFGKEYREKYLKPHMNEPIRRLLDMTYAIHRGTEMPVDLPKLDRYCGSKYSRQLWEIRMSSLTRTRNGLYAGNKGYKVKV